MGWLETAGESCSSLAWLLSNCKESSSRIASINFIIQSVAFPDFFPFWIWMRITMETSSAYIKRMCAKFTYLEFLFAAHAFFLYFTRIFWQKRFGGQISLNWFERDLWLSSKVASQFSDCPWTLEEGFKVLACRTGVIFCVFQGNRGEREASAKRELHVRGGSLKNPTCPHTIEAAAPAFKYQRGYLIAYFKTRDPQMFSKM